MLLKMDFWPADKTSTPSMITPRGELFLPRLRRYSKPAEMPEVHLRTQASGLFKHQLRLHKDSKSHAMGTVFGSCLGRGNPYPLFPLFVYKVC